MEYHQNPDIEKWLVSYLLIFNVKYNSGFLLFRFVRCVAKSVRVPKICKPICTSIIQVPEGTRFYSFRNQIHLILFEGFNYIRPRRRKKVAKGRIEDFDDETEGAQNRKTFKCDRCGKVSKTLAAYHGHKTWHR